MPRLKRTEAQCRADRFSELYRVGKARVGMTDEQVSDMLGICRSALFRYRKDPDRLDLGQLAKMGKAFGWTSEDYMAIIRPGV